MGRRLFRSGTPVSLEFPLETKGWGVRQGKMRVAVIDEEGRSINEAIADRINDRTANGISR